MTKRPGFGLVFLILLYIIQLRFQIVLLIIVALLHVPFRSSHNNEDGSQNSQDRKYGAENSTQSAIAVSEFIEGKRNRNKGGE